MNILNGILKEAVFLFNRMSPYLIFGFLLAGFVHIFLNTETVARHLGKNSFFSVIKASLFGIPLPLCSCSVIPTAMGLRKEGASKGAVLSFLISAPTTGIDSILATYSLLGGLFTIYRIMASFVTGVLAGLVTNFSAKEPAGKEPPKTVFECKMCPTEHEHTHGILHKIKTMFAYAFGDLVNDTGMAVLIGIIIGGIITYFMPSDFVSLYLGTGIKAMFIMLIAGIPMYVCATASIPIAAALMLKGMNPGACFVFLVAGPATNIVTMTVVAKNMGIRTLAAYLGSIVAGSVVLGLALDAVYAYIYPGREIAAMLHEGFHIPAPVYTVSSITLFILIMANYFTRRFRGISVV